MNSALQTRLSEAIVVFFEKFFRHEGDDGCWSGVLVRSETGAFVAHVSASVHKQEVSFHMPSWRGGVTFSAFPCDSARLKGQPCCWAIKMCRSVGAGLQPWLHDITNVLFWEGSVLRVRGVTTHPRWVVSADSRGFSEKYGTDIISWPRPPFFSPRSHFVHCCHLAPSLISLT